MCFFNFMFFWPCIMNWLYINYQLLCTNYYLFIKYYSPLHVSSIKCSSSGGHSYTYAAYGTLTLYESSWWPVGTQLEWELTGGGRLLVGVLIHPPTTFPLQSVLPIAAYLTGHQDSYREWRYHMLLVRVYNYVLLKMSTWCSKHVEESNILRINNSQCIKLVINV